MRGSSSPNTIALAGWLFADLLLGIGLLFFVADSRAAATVAPTTLTTPSPTVDARQTLVMSVQETISAISARQSSTSVSAQQTANAANATQTALALNAQKTSSAAQTAFVVSAQQTASALSATQTAVAQPGPGIRIGLNPSPYLVTLRTDPETFLKRDKNEQGYIDALFQTQVQYYFDSSGRNKSRVGLVLATGDNSDEDNGHALAKGAIRSLLNKYPDVFRDAIPKDYHRLLQNEPYLNGIVKLEVYFLEDDRTKAPPDVLGVKLDFPDYPPAFTWCDQRGDWPPGSEGARLEIVNWTLQPFNVSLDSDPRPYQVKSASVDPYRTFGCILISPIRHTLHFASLPDFTIPPERPYRVEVCTAPLRICAAGKAGTIGGEGEQKSPSR